MRHPAHYNDGKTAARLMVTAEQRGDALILTDADGAEIAAWPLHEIRAAEDGSVPLRFRRTGGDARLAFTAPDGGRWLAGLCPKLRAADRGGRRWPAWLAAGLAAGLSVVGIFIFLIPNFAGAVTGLVPLAVERRIGAESLDQALGMLGRINRNPLRCQDPRAEEILNTHARELAAVMESPFDIQLTVVRFPIANALTLPGGHVVILSGLLDAAESGDEVIGVLAHEIAHVVRRDPLQLAIQQAGTSLLIGLLIGDVFGGAVLTGGASAVIESGYSRAAEADADAMAVTALNRLGLQARPLADFLARLGNTDGDDRVPGFLNTHPSSAARKSAIEAMAQGHGRAMTGFDWQAVKAMCRP